MGQITNPGSKGITVLPTDRESGPGAGAGATGNNSIFLGLNAGKNSTSADTIVIGNNSGGGTIPNTMTGTTIVGQGSLNALNSDAGIAPDAVTVLGQGNAPLLTQASATIIIGTGNLPVAVSFIASSIFIGEAIGGNFGPNGASVVSNVVIGYKALQLATLMNGGMNQNVIIGANAYANAASAPSASVIIGYNAASSCSLAGSDIMIGQLASTTGSSGGNVVIGTNTTCGTPNCTNNVVVGANTTTQVLGSSNVCLGFAAVPPALAANVRSIIIGSSAGRTLANTLSNILCIETNDAADAQRAMLYGDMRTGNLVLGNSTDAASRDLISGGTATNTVRLLNGTIAGAAPASGGYFYVTAGNLHWVSSAGVDSQLNETAAGQLAANAIAAYTNNAGAQIATITNGPTAGNPTKWIPINDNGVIRNIPAW